MAVKVTVVSDARNRISINNQQRKTVRTVAVTPATTSLAALSDVIATSPNENETLVYDQALGKYVVKTLPLVDGGHY